MIVPIQIYQTINKSFTYPKIQIVHLLFINSCIFKHEHNIIVDQVVRCYLLQLHVILLEQPGKLLKNVIEPNTKAHQCNMRIINSPNQKETQYHTSAIRSFHGETLKGQG